ncbi:hypothetical protein PI125_g11784 [Phytophthora idaei]|nr:hypothetical protein PI125_g11784 [Phytophthora idaei]
MWRSVPPMLGVTSTEAPLYDGTGDNEIPRSSPP